MRFSVDAHALGRHLTGNETYVRNLLHCFASLDQDAWFATYLFRHPPLEDLPGRRPCPGRACKRANASFLRAAMKYPAEYRAPLLCVLALAITAAPASTPVFENEQLRYNINWPSGLSLGEAELSASSSKTSPDSEPRWHFRFDIDASVPGSAVADRYRSETSGDFCSAEFQRTTTHGQKKTDERSTFHPQERTITRETASGGKSEASAPQCAKDALTFLYYLRRELSQGRIPPPQTVFFGSPYEIRLEFAGAQSIRIADKPIDADRVTASVKGPASEFSFELFFLKDRARTLALVRVPLALGTFSMELVK